MNFDAASAIADAVLMEGYALYPYRASAPKNRFRWTFGVLAPRGWSASGGCEPWWLEAQVLVAGAPTRVGGRLRCFQIERRHPDEAGELGGWDEGMLRSFEFGIDDGVACVPFGFEGASSRARGELRERRALAGVIVLHRERLPSPRPLTKLTIRVENWSTWTEANAPRERAMMGSLASTHLLIGVEGGTLLSAIDPPDWAHAEAATCVNVRTYPVLLGPPGRDELLIAAPFIMYDHPRLAPESAGDLCDATEIDELLTLRTRTLTATEKREARATDPRAAAIIERADALTAEPLARMHGAARELRGGEMVPRGTPPVPGTKVRLRAAQARTDAQDLLYAGHVATVVEVREDVDGTTFLGVTIDDDPAAELHRWYGRCHYYRVDEVEVL